MKISSCYLSCPLSVPQQTLDKYLTLLKRWLPKEKVYHWQRGTAYTSLHYGEIIENVDAFVLVLPDNSFKMPIANMSAGIKRELEIAFNNNKRLYLAYEAAQGFNIYEAVAEHSNGTIKSFNGIAGTSSNFMKATEESLEEKEEKTNGKRFFIMCENGAKMYTKESTEVRFMCDLNNNSNLNFDYILLENKLKLDWNYVKCILAFYESYRPGTTLTFNLVNKYFSYTQGANLNIICGENNHRNHRLEMGRVEDKGYAKYLGEIKTMGELKAARKQSNSPFDNYKCQEYQAALAEPTSATQQKQRERDEAFTEAYDVAYEQMYSSINDVFEAHLLWGKPTSKFKRVMFRKR